MDEFIRTFDASRDDDLMLCPDEGVAYQRDMSFRVPVGYYEKCRTYSGSDISNDLHFSRVKFVNKYVGDGTAVLDIGVGCGEFIQWRPNTFGYDVDEDATEWLKKEGYWSDNFRAFRAFTFWDVLEHIETPEDYFKYMVSGTRLFTCLPIFNDLGDIRRSKHYRPGEHLYYFTKDGFVRYMGMHRFDLVGVGDFETKAGRDSIVSFAFERHP